MVLREWYHLLVAASVNCLITIAWQKIMARRKSPSFLISFLIFLGSFFSAWGMDVLQRLLEVFTIFQMMKISLGCWLMFAAATGAPHYAVNGWSKKNFWIDYIGDLIGFMFMGLVIYALT